MTRRLLAVLILLGGLFWGASASGAVLINALPVSIESGTNEIGPVVIPDGLQRIKLRFKRATTLTPTFWTNPVTKIDARLDVSYDGGQTFQLACAFEMYGGIRAGRNGVELSESFVQCSLQPGTSRLVKASVTVTNGPLASEVSVEVE